MTETERNGKRDGLAASVEQKRIAQLEEENERLRSRLRKLEETHECDVALLKSYTLERLPKTEDELLRIAREGPSFKELLNELFEEIERDAKL